MSLVTTVLAFLLVIGPLVVFHEFGHYLVARLCGVKVLRFSVGMGKIVWSRRFGRDQTEWAISALPIGGYVKMVDKRDPTTVPRDESEAAREFTSQKVLKRIAIIAAGPLANFLLAIIVFAALFMHGVIEPTARVSAGAQTSAAWQAGVRANDTVIAVNGEEVRSFPELNWKMLSAAIDKDDARLELREPAGSTYTAVIPAATMAKVNVDGDVLGELGLQMWRPPVKLGEVVAGGPAARAGLQSGDLVSAIDGKPVPDAVAFIGIVQKSAGRTLTLDVNRGGQMLKIQVTPERDAASGHGMIQAGIASPPETALVQYAPGPALRQAVTRTWDLSAMIVKMIGKMIVGESSLKNLSGPITIADAAKQSAQAGLAVFLSFVAFVSISLGVMNLLPIPVLDGGHLLYYSVEVLTGRPLPERIGEIAQRAGVGLLFMLMALAVFNDLVRLF